ncbi:hypothetical protein [Lactobacillus phage Semele]|uniref:Uncharacterized protein n=1 Tax=Lactobacillus phage Semele TaxID=2079433 RepID=A0A2K9VD90_9CAUD|nr:hypothetical protein HOS80_gp172 [Lactobacillus phage Semele]AUV60203.1 hypothetical protein [Lactobacillus phage Semele]
MDIVLMLSAESLYLRMNFPQMHKSGAVRSTQEAESRGSRAQISGFLIYYILSYRMKKTTSSNQNPCIEENHFNPPASQRWSWLPPKTGGNTSITL